MSVTLTEKAAKEIHRFIEEGDYDENAVLRVGVSGGGCSGFNYTLNIASDFDQANDNKSQQHGVDVVVDKKSALFLEGNDRRLLRRSRNNAVSNSTTRNAKTNLRLRKFV